MRRWIATSHLYPPSPLLFFFFCFFLLLSSLLQQQKTVYTHTIRPACAAVHTLLKHSVRMSKGPNCKQRSSCGCLLCIGFFFPSYIPEIISFGGSGVSEMDCGVCIFSGRGRRRLFFFFFFPDVSARCAAFMGLHYNPFCPLCCFSLHVIASAQVMQTLGLRTGLGLKTFHPRTYNTSFRPLCTHRPTLS